MLAGDMRDNESEVPIFLEKDPCRFLPIQFGRGLIVFMAGGGILEKPAESNTGNRSRTRCPEAVTTSRILKTKKIHPQ